MTETCVFCGRPIAADEPRVGRGETAAHAACADAALADERGWERLAVAMDDAGAADVDEGARGSPSGAGPGGALAPGAGRARAGCLALLVIAVLGLAAS